MEKQLLIFRNGVCIRTTERERTTSLLHQYDVCLRPGTDGMEVHLVAPTATQNPGSVLWALPETTEKTTAIYCCYDPVSKILSLEQIDPDTQPDLPVFADYGDPWTDPVWESIIGSTDIELSLRTPPPAGDPTTVGGTSSVFDVNLNNQQVRITFDDTHVFITEEQIPVLV